MIKKQFKIQGMHCTSCSMLIEGELEDIGAQAQCNYATQVVDVEYDEQKISEEEIKGVIQTAGYIVSGS